MSTTWKILEDDCREVLRSLPERSVHTVVTSPEYARMARERIETAVRLGFRAPVNGPEQIPGQVSIFDLDGAA